jgi:Kef-type K+ transport system membrane component KefB
MEQILLVLILLIFARLLGRVAERLGQPSSIGELLAGLIVGLSLAAVAAPLPELAALRTDGLIPHFADLGIFFVILAVGVDMQPHEIADHSRESLLIAVCGALLPLAGGIAMGYAYLPVSEVRDAQALVIGTALCVSAIPVTAKVFMDFGILHTRPGQVVVAAAVFDDVIALFLLAVVSGIAVGGQAPTPASLALMMFDIVVFFAVTIMISKHLIPRVFQRFKVLHGFGFELSLLLALAVLFALLAEALGMHFVLGPFVAGLYFDRKSLGAALYERTDRLVTILSKGVFGPIFFATLGLGLNLDAITAVPAFLAFLLVTAFFGKMVGAGIPALAAGMTPHEAALVATGMNARGAVELVVVQVAGATSLFSRPDPAHPIIANLFDALIITAVITTLATPILLRLILGRSRGAGAA